MRTPNLMSRFAFLHWNSAHFRDSHHVEPGRLDARVTPLDLIDTERLTAVDVGKVARTGQAEFIPKKRSARMFQHASHTTHDVYGMGRQFAILRTLASMAKQAPRSARRMRHNRQGTLVRARVPLFVIPPAKKARVRPSSVDVERDDVLSHESSSFFMKNTYHGQARAAPTKMTNDTIAK